MLSVPSGILAVVYVGRSRTIKEPIAAKNLCNQKLKRRQNTNMKTENQIELTQTVAPRRNLALRTAVAPW